MPKGFQVSQYDYPIAFNGYLDIEVNGETKRIGIERLHIEEDPGKLVHLGETITVAQGSLIDYNRSGMPLVEIVTKPVIHSGEEASRLFRKTKTNFGIHRCF